MKRYFVIFLVCVLTAVFVLPLVACDTEQGDPLNNDTSRDDVHSSNSEESFDNNSEFNEDTAETATKTEATDGPGISGYKAQYYSAFSEGIALIVLPHSTMVHGFDQYGNILFEVDTQKYGAPCGISSFYNGIAMIECSYSKNNILIDVNGNILDASMVGGTTFVPNEEVFKDGYVFVKKTTTDFQGSYDEYAIVNSKLEIVVDYSEKLYEDYEAIVPQTYYIQGYLIGRVLGGKWKALSVNTGELTEPYSSLESVFDAIGIDKNLPSDTWDWGYERRCYDIFDNIKVDLSEYKSTINSISVYKDGYAMVEFLVKESSAGTKHYVVIIDEKGEFLFEPVEIREELKKMENAGNGEFWLRTKDNYWITFDKNGKRAEMHFTKWKAYNVAIGDGLIMVVGQLDYAYAGSNVACYTFDLEKR